MNCAALEKSCERCWYRTRNVPTRNAMVSHSRMVAGGVSWKPKLAPAVSGVFGGSGSSPYIEDGIAYVGAVGVSRGDLGADRRSDFALRPLQCTEGQPRHVRRGFAEARDRCLEGDPLRCGRGLSASTLCTLLSRRRV
jgi:hypothetical protein